MNLFLVLLIATVFSMISMLMIRLNDTEDDPKDPREASLLPEKEPTEYGFYIYCTVILLCNCFAAGFMRLYYKTDMLEITQVLLALMVLWACAWVDQHSMRIPNQILMVGIGIRVVHLIINILMSPQLVSYILLSSIIPTLALLFVTFLCRLINKNAIGFGDVKLLMFLGFCLQNDRAWTAILLSMVVSFFYSLFLVVVKKANSKTEIPFAPILLIGTLAASIMTTV